MFSSSNNERTDENSHNGRMVVYLLAGHGCCSAMAGCEKYHEALDVLVVDGKRRR
jgi:hypothetical protein